MCRLTTAILFVVLLAIAAPAQSPAHLLKQVRKIRLLESTRIDVGQILFEFKLEDTDSGRQTFNTDEFDVEIIYTTGECAEEADETFDGEIWAIDESKVQEIRVEFDEPMNARDLGLVLSRFTKEQKYAKDEHTFVFHDKAAGIAFETNEYGVQKVSFFPPRALAKKLCKGTNSLKRFYSKDSWFDTKLEERHGETYCPVASVLNVELSISEIAGATSEKTIAVTTTASDPENDVLTYVYKVSAGQIKGTGPKVVWDLTGVPAGTYTLTAGVDDGCGLCGKTFTKQIVIK